MKAILFILILSLTLVACSKDNGGSKKKVKISNPATSPDDSDATPAIPDEFEHLKKTNLIQRQMYCCLLDPNDPPLKSAVDRRKIDGTPNDNFDLIMNHKFIEKVVSDLINKSRGQKISPDFFWNNLDSNLATKLNSFLAHKYMNVSDEMFDLIRRLFAYAITYFMETQDYNTGYIVQYGDSQFFKIAFSSNAKIVEKIKVCSMKDLRDYIIIPSNLLTPGQITGSIECKKGSHQVNITVYNRSVMKVNIKSQNKTFNLYLDKVDIDRDSDEVEIEASGRDLEISLVLSRKVSSRTRRGLLGRIFGSDYSYSYHPDLYSKIELDIEARGFDFDESNLACKNIKRFQI